MPPPTIFLLFLTICLPLSLSAPHSSKSLATFDICTPFTSCPAPLTCSPFNFPPTNCSDADPLCFCLPKQLKSCAEPRYQCANGETCAQDLSFKTVCASKTAIATLSFLGRAPPTPVLPSSGLPFDSCSNAIPRSCAPKSFCATPPDLSFRCTNERNCVCIPNAPHICISDNDCPNSQVCTMAPILDVPFCAAEGAVPRWKGLKSVNNPNPKGLVFDSCTEEDDCVSGRSCRSFEDLDLNCEDSTGPCVCWRKRGGECRETADCKNKGEVCAEIKVFPGLRKTCVSIAARTLLPFIEQIQGEDMCPILLPYDIRNSIHSSRGLKLAKVSREWVRSPILSEKEALMTNPADRGQVKLNFTERVTGGTRVKKSLQSYMVAIQTKDGFCSGVLIGKHWALSAAHCEIDEGDLVALQRRRHVLGNLQADNQVRRVFVHPRYVGGVSRNEQFDVVLIQLDKPARNGASFMKINMFTSLARGGQAVRALGFGKIRQIRKERELILGQVDLRVIGVAECNRRNREIAVKRPINRRNQICAAVSRERCGPCFGDSGGPLIQYMEGVEEPILVGITSLSVTCDTLQFPAVFTRMSALTVWLLETPAKFETNASDGTRNICTHDCSRRRPRRM